MVFDALAREVTFQEVRGHLGVETQRQWSDLAIARTTPILLGLFSIVTFGARVISASLANRLAQSGKLPVRQAAWYRKPRATFSDAIALVRERIWLSSSLTAWRKSDKRISSPERGEETIPRALLDALLLTACYAE